MAKLTVTKAGEMALALPGVTVKDHFGADAYAANGRNFMTGWHEFVTVNMMLPLDAQKRFVTLDGEVFTPVENAWGKQGWTTVNLEYVDLADFKEALRIAYDYSAMKRPPLGTRKAKRKKLVRKTGSNRKRTKKAVPKR